MRIIKLSGTTDASGDLTLTSMEVVVGQLLGIAANLSDLDATADSTITVENTDDEALAILTLTDNQTDDYFVPTPSVVTKAGVAVTDGHALFAVAGTFKVVVAAGGNAKVCAFVFYVHNLK